MENRFVNYTTLAVNTILIFLSIIFVVLVHTHKVCPPPDFILNSENHEGDRCIFARNSSASLSLDTLHSFNESNIISSRKQTDNLNQDIYSFDILMFSLVMPMGLTSLLMALSRQWISNVQEWKILKMLKSVFKIPQISQHPNFYLQVDTLKALIVVASSVSCFIFLTPIGFSAANLTTTCATIPTMCIVFDFVLIIICATIFFCLDTQSAFTLMSCAKRKQNDSTEHNDDSPTTKYPKIEFIFSLLIFVTTVVSAVILSFYSNPPSISKTNSDSDPLECDAEIYNIVKYLIFAYVLMVVPTFLLVIHYSITVQKIYYINNHHNKYEKRAQNNVDVELDLLSNKKLITTVPE